MEQELIREINEAMAREKWLTLWQRHKRGLFSAVAIALFAMVATVLWQERQQTKKIDESDTLLKVVARLGQPQGAESDADAVIDEDSKGNRAALARLIKVNQLIKQGDDEKAIAALVALLDSKASPELKQHACAIGQIVAAQEDAFSACETPASYAPLLAEFKAVQQVNAGDETAALAQLPEKPASEMQNRRLEDLRAFLRSTRSETMIPAKPE